MKCRQVFGLQQCLCFKQNFFIRKQQAIKSSDLKWRDGKPQNFKNRNECFEIELLKSKSDLFLSLQVWIFLSTYSTARQLPMNLLLIVQVWTGKDTRSIRRLSVSLLQLSVTFSSCYASSVPKGVIPELIFKGNF